MVLTGIGGGGGFDYVQNTEPTNPEIGESWFDASVDPNGASKIYADLGGGAGWHVLPGEAELTSGRTRELLLLLQDKPIPDVVDPLNIQNVLSEGYVTDDNGDYQLTTYSNDVDSTVNLPNQDGFENRGDGTGLVINTNQKLSEIRAEVGSLQSEINEITLRNKNTSTDLVVKSGTWNSGDIVTIEQPLENNTDYILISTSNSGDTGVISSSNLSLPYTSTALDVTGGWEFGGVDENINTFISVRGIADSKLSGYVTDQFGAPTTEPTDFKAWNAIQARDVTAGGSTITNPIEFDILDSTDTVLNTTKISEARIADEPFKMRNRVAPVTASSDGQSDYQIATTGNGGHFGIPVLTVVSVKKNGSVLDSANWSFDGDTTVTIDTSNVSIASGDTIDIKYDFDVFDSTLQPRAYLSRKASTETSPSISHFRYEYQV